MPDAADPRDLITRMNVLAQLGDPGALLQDVRSALVVATGAHGRVAVRDILVASGRSQPARGETVLSPAQIDAALAAAAAHDRTPIEAAAASAAAARAIESLLADKAGAVGAPDLHALADLLKPVAAACANAIAQLAGAAAHATAAAPGSTASRPRPRRRNRRAPVKSATATMRCTRSTRSASFTNAPSRAIPRPC